MQYQFCTASVLILFPNNCIFIVYRKVRTASYRAAYISLGIIHIHIDRAFTFTRLVVIFVVETIFTHFQQLHPPLRR